MTDSADLGRATLRIDVDTGAFSNALKSIRDQAANFRPSFSGIQASLNDLTKTSATLVTKFATLERQVQQLNKTISNTRLDPKINTQTAESNINKLITSAQSLSRILDRLKKPTVAFDANVSGRSTREGADQAADAYAVARKEISAFTKDVINGEKALGTTTSAIQQQARAFVELASNAKIGEAAFNNFVQAGEQARQKLNFTASFQEIAALQNTYNLGKGNPKNKLSQSTFMGTEELLAFSSKPNTVLNPATGTASPAAIETYIRALRRAQEFTPGFSEDYARLTRAIEAYSIRLQRIRTGLTDFSVVRPNLPPLLAPAENPFLPAIRGGARPISAPAAGASYDRLAANDLRFARRQGKLQDLQSYFADIVPNAGGVRVNDAMRMRGNNSALDSAAYREQERAAQSILEIELKRIQTLRQITQRLQENTAATKGFLEFSQGANQPPSAIDKSIRRNQELNAKRLQNEFPPLNINTLQDRLEVIKRISNNRTNATGFGNASQAFEPSSDPSVLKAIRRNQDKVARRLEQRERIEAQFNADLEDVRKRRIASEKRRADSPAAKAGLDAELAAIRKPRPGAGRLGSFAEGIRGRFGATAQSAVIGGAFPALFGQGLAASAGGFTGGALGGLIGGQGGGFAGSLLGTSLGAFVDSLSAVSNAFRDPIGQFQALKDAALLSSKGIERNIESLINQGRNAEAAALIQDDLAKRFGNIEEFKRFQTAQEELQRAFGDLGIQLTKVVQGPLTQFTTAISNILRGSTPEAVGNRAVISGLLRTPTFRKAFEQALAPGFRLNSRGQVSGGTTGQNSAEFGRAGLVAGIATGTIADPAKAQQEEQRRTNAIIVAGNREFEQAKATRYASIRAEIQGNKTLNLTLQEQVLIAERKQALAGAAPEKQAAIELDYEERLLRVREQQLQLQRELSIESLRTQNRITTSGERSQIEALRPALSGTGIGILRSINSFRDARRTANEARFAAQLNPGNAQLQNAAQEASATLKEAAVSFRADLINGFFNARKEAEAIGRSLRDATLNLLQIRNDTAQGSLNSFLDPYTVGIRQRAVFSELKPKFDEAKQYVRDNINTNFMLDFSGPTGAVNDSMRNFIDAVNRERDAVGNIRDIQIENTKALNVLTEAITKLATRDWNVSLAINGERVSATGDVLGGTAP